MRIITIYIIGIIISIIGIILSIITANMLNVSLSILWLLYWGLCLYAEIKYPRNDINSKK